MGAARLYFLCHKEAMEMKFLIDRTELPYDAMVNDPSWLCPIYENDKEGGEADGYEREKTETDSGEGPGRKSRKATTESK